MAHCINCDVLISDRPNHGDFCSPECAAEYRAGADPAKLTAADIDKLTNTIDSSTNSEATNNAEDTSSKKS